RAPVPRHVVHGWLVGTVSETCPPWIACSKLSDTSVSRSRPRSARGPVLVRVPPRPPPNRFDRMSPHDDGSNPAPGPGPVANGFMPARSYSRRLSGSLSTSYACWISLKRSSALGSPGLRSGWYWRASLRYAFLISSAEAFLPTPRTEYRS